MQKTGNLVLPRGKTCLGQRRSPQSRFLDEGQTETEPQVWVRIKRRMRAPLSEAVIAVDSSFAISEANVRRITRRLSEHRSEINWP